MVIKELGCLIPNGYTEYIYMRIYIHNLRVCNVCMYIYIYTHAYIHSLFLLQSMGHTVTHLGHVYRHHLARIALPFASL